MALPPAQETVLVVNDATQPIPVTPSGVAPGAATEAKQDDQIVLATAGNVSLAAIAVSTDNIDDKLAVAAAPADAESNAIATTNVRSRLMTYNGGTWDRVRSGLVGLQTLFTGLQNIIAVVRYNAVRVVLADGNFTELQGNTRGDLAVCEQFAPTAEDNPNSVYASAYRIVPVAAYAATVLVTDYAATVTKNAKNTAGVVTSVYGSNRNAALRYLQLHNTATVPGAGAVPLISIGVLPNAVNPGQSIIFDDALFSQGGVFFSLGIAYAWSTTEGTYTAATAADHSTTVIGK